MCDDCVDQTFGWGRGWDGGYGSDCHDEGWIRSFGVCVDVLDFGEVDEVQVWEGLDDGFYFGWVAVHEEDW